MLAPALLTSWLPAPAHVPHLTAASAQGGEDPFSQQQAAKQKSIKAQGKRQLSNLKAQAKAEGRPELKSSRADPTVSIDDYGARRQSLTKEVRHWHAWVLCGQCMPAIGTARTCLLTCHTR